MCGGFGLSELEQRVQVLLQCGEGLGDVGLLKISGQIAQTEFWSATRILKLEWVQPKEGCCSAGRSRAGSRLLLGPRSGSMNWQVIKIVNELVKVAMRTHHGSFGFMSMRNWLKLSAPSTTQTHELKTNVMPWEGTDLVNWKDAIEFVGGSSMRSPTWHASCQCFTGCPSRGIPKV
jgi:hypothetical protein